MIETAETLAREFAISREAADEFAATSDQRAAAAWNEGRFDADVVPVPVPQPNNHQSVSPINHRDSQASAIRVTAPIRRGFMPRSM